MRRRMEVARQSLMVWEQGGLPAMEIDELYR